MSDGASPPREAQAWAALSQRLGKDLLLTQGSGGNTSVKLDDRRLLVKCSGHRLGEVTAEAGWGLADTPALRQGIAGLDRHKEAKVQSKAYQALLQSATILPGRALSLETGLHALLPDRWVAHVHSIAGQLLGLMPEEEARDLAARALGPGFPTHRIPPAIPGHDLCGFVARRLAEVPQAEDRGSSLWVFANHGIAWGAETDREILRRSGIFEDFFRKRFELDRFPPPLVEPLGEGPFQAPRGKSWHRVSLVGWPDARFEELPVLTDFPAHFGRTPPAPPEWVKGDDRTAFLLARSPRDMETRSQVFFAHALVSTVAHREGWFHPLPAPIAQAIQDLSLESASYA